jgi:alkylation response protein AidB-like acyl-CoA dehydrogenase
VNVSISDEQRLLRDTAHGIGRRLSANPATLTAARADGSGAELLAELGLVQMRMPEEFGGAGASAFDVMLVTEALAQRAAVVPFFGPVLASELVNRSTPSAELTGSPGMLTVALSHSLAEGVTEADAERVGWDAAAATHAFAITPVDSASTLDVSLVQLATDELASADVTRILRRVTSTEPPVASLDEDGLHRWLAFALAMLAADLVGTMAGALELAVTHVSDRTQFGRPLGSFQALQHMLADAHTSAEAARVGVLHAAWAVDVLAPREALLAARIAKAYAAGAALQVTEATMQAHGGMGITWESPCHVYLRRAILGIATLGDERAQLNEIANARMSETGAR